MLLRSLTIALMLAAFPATAGTQSNVGGDYASNWEDVKLVQEGNWVHGTYVCCGGGTIEGKIYDGRVIRYHWKQSGGEGEGVWEILPNGRLEGTWGSGASDDDGGRWDLQLKSALAN